MGSFSGFSACMARRLGWVLVMLFALPPAHAVQVVASIRPLALIAQAVLGSTGRVQQLLPEGASAHDYQLRASDYVTLQRASTVLWVGPAHELFLQKTLRNSPARVLTAQTLRGLHTYPERRVSDGRALSGSVDAHLWLSAGNAVLIARALAQQLSAQDPAHAVRYQHNAEQFAARMGALKTQQQAQFSALKSRAFMAYHDAYQYAEKDFSLQYRGSLTVHDEGAPSAQALQKNMRIIQQENLHCLLAEPGFNQALAKRAFAGGKTATRFTVIDEFFTQAPLTPSGFEQAYGTLGAQIYQCVK